MFLSNLFKYNKMKKYFIISILAVTTSLFTACQDELDITDSSKLTVAQFINNAETAETALLNAYHDLQSEYVGGAYPKMFSGLYADNFDHSGSFPSFTEIWTNNIIATNANLDDFYLNHYDIINTTTEVIRLTEEVSVDLFPASEKAPILAEAHALRAFAYFELVKVFGGVPINELTVPLDGDAANNVPRSTQSEVYSYIESEIAAASGITNTANTRFTNNALMVLKAKVQLYQANYTDAETTLAGLIGSYSLASTYASLYTVGGSTPETIFRVDYTASDSNSLAFFFYPSAGGGRREVAPSQELLNDFAAGDLRKDLIANNTDFASSYLNKYQDTGSGTDQPYVFRYADVLLMYAEVLARRDDPTASTYINMVRTRAGLGDVNLTSANVINLIANERRFEFFGEGDRWDDIKRLGIAQQIIEGKVVGTYDANKLLWPIPQEEIDTNDAISQADQNPGY